MAVNWSTPDAELVLTVYQCKDRDLWLAERRKGIGGSDMASLVGEGKYANQTEYDIWLDKTGRGGEDIQSLAMELGSRWEQAVADKFSEESGLSVQRRGLMRSKGVPQLLANVDRLVDDGGGLECKTTNQFVKIPPDDPDPRRSIPRHWYWQIIVYLAVTGRSHWYLAVAVGNTGWVTRIVYRRDVLDDIERVLKLVPEWWFNHVIADVAPEYGGPPSMDEVPAEAKREFPIPAQLWDMRARLRDLRATASDAKKEAEALRDEIKAFANGAEYLTANGVPVLRVGDRVGNLTFKKARFNADHPEIDIDTYYERNRPSKIVYIIGGDDDE